MHFGAEGFFWTVVLCGLGSGLGGVFRHLVADWVATWHNHHFPLGIFLVNVSGAFVIGMVWGLLPGASIGRDFLMLGVLGGYTTVSTYALNTFALWRAGHLGWAALNVVLSLLLCLLAVWGGELLAGLLV
jgi:CrcB protein